MHTFDEDSDLFGKYDIVVNVCDRNMRTIRSVIFGDAPTVGLKLPKSSQPTSKPLQHDELEALMAEYLEDETKQDPVIISESNIFGYHTVLMFSEILARITDIPPYRQYLSINFDDPLTHSIRNILSGELIAQHFSDNNESVSGIGINISYYESKQTLGVVGREMSVVLSDIFDRNMVNTLYLIDLEAVTKHSNISEHDKIYIYYGLVIRFWPMTYEMFEALLSGHETSINAALLYYKNLDKTPKHKLDLFISESISELETNSFTNTLFIEHTVYASTLLKTRRLFELWHASEMFPIIRSAFNIGGQQIIVSRVDRTSKYRDHYSKLKKYLNIKHRELVGIFVQGERLYSFTLSNNYYALKSFVIEKVDRETIVIDMNMFASVINEFSGLVFQDRRRLRVATISNIVVTDMSVRLVLPKNVRDNFGEVVDIMRKSSLFDVTDVGHGKLTGKFSYQYNADPSAYIQKYSGTYYDYLVSATAKSILDIYFPTEYHITIMFDTSVSVNIEGVNNIILSVFRRVMCNVLDRVVGKKASAVLSYKDVKLHDPVLYKVEGFNVSKACQKRFFPKAVTEEAYNNMDASMQKKFIKYKNFTTGNPLYYGCLDPALSVLYFITDKHPDGLCYACCGKKAKGAKKTLAYNKCLTEHKFISEDESATGFARFVIKYTREKVEVDRLMQLPSKLADAINEATINKYMSEGKVIVGKASYSLAAIMRVLGDGGHRSMPLKRFDHNLDQELPSKPGFTWRKLLSDPDLSPTIYASITSSNINDIVYVFGQDIILGMPIFARAYLETKGKGKVNIRKINSKHLSKARKQSVVSNYFLYSCKQMHNYLKLGSIFAISKALDIDAHKLLDDICDLLANPPDDLAINITTTYPTFETYEATTYAFMHDLAGELSDTNWNELAIMSASKLLEISVVSLCYEGESFLINASSIGDKLIVLLNDNTIGNYYPIILTSSKNFVGGVSKSIYDRSDVLYDFIKDLTKQAYRGQTEDAFYDIFAQHIVRVFVSRGNIVYGVGIKYAGKEYYVPINFHEYNMRFKAESKPFLVKNIKYTFAEWVGFMKFYNNMILNDPLIKRGPLSNDDNEVLAREMSYIPRTNYIRAESFVECQSEIIGIKSNDLYYYFKSVDILDIRSEMQSALDNYPFMIGDFNTVAVIYHPDIINAVCARHKQSNLDVTTYRKSLYKSNIMMLASIELYQYIMYKQDETYYLGDLELDEREDYDLDKLDLDMIESICREVFDVSEPDLTLPYIISKCGFSRNIFCKGSKLVVAEGFIKMIANEFYKDIKNPFKRPFMDRNLIVYTLFRSGEMLVAENEIIFY